MNAIGSLRRISTERDKSLARLAVDWAIYFFILMLGAFQFAHYPHCADYLADVTYPDLAGSILEKGTYVLRLQPQTTLPPGLPIILAMVGRLAGLSPVITFGVVAISTALGLITAYEL